MSLIDSAQVTFDPPAAWPAARAADPVKDGLNALSVNERIAKARLSYLAWVALQSAGNASGIEEGANAL
jgi:hypothetical protein